MRTTRTPDEKPPKRSAAGRHRKLEGYAGTPFGRRRRPHDPFAAAFLLTDHDYDVVEAASGTAAVEAFGAGGIDLILLDLRLPGMSGFDVCRTIRRQSEVPIIIVSARPDSHDIVAGLELGADDYVTKPFEDHELLARVRVQLRVHRREAVHRVTVGDVVIKESEGVVLKGGHPVPLTKTEFRLLCHLASQVGRLWSRQQLLEMIWDHPLDGDGRLVDTHVARLRSKLEDSPGEPAHLLTVRGLGYKLVR